MDGSKVWIQNGIIRNSLRTELLCEGNKKEMEREKEREVRGSHWVGGTGMPYFPARANGLKS